MSEKMVEISKQYKRVFKKNGLDIQIMPLRADNKNPIRKHKGGVYKDERIIYNLNNWYDNSNKALCNYGWLMNEQVFCIDFDGYSSVDAKMHPEQYLKEKQQTAKAHFDEFVNKYGSAGSWIEKTKKGFHMIWKKPQELKDCTLATDAFKNSGFKGIDFVTVTNSVHDGIPSSAILAVYPSKGKTWMDGNNPLNDDPLSDPPANLVDWIKTNITKSKPKNKDKPQTKTKISVNIKRRVIAHGSENDHIELMKILEVLPEKYYEDTNNGGDWKLWFKVMLGIQYLMGENGYEAWVNFNKRASCWTPEMQEINKTRYWDENIGLVVDKPVKIGSLRYWCKTDAPQAWAVIKKDSIFKQQLDALNGTWYDLACLCCLQLNDIFFDETTNTWVKFESGIWHRDYRSLIIDLNELVKPKFINDMNNWYDKLILSETNENKKEELKCKKKNVLKVANRLGNDHNRVINAMKSICSRTVEFDENPWLIGFKDGWVYDLLLQEFRPADKEDMVSLYCGVSSHSVRNVSDDDIQEIKSFLCDILPDSEVLDYQLYLCALALNGIEAKKFVCQNGTGANGKSTLMDLLTKMYGDYAKHAGTELYTRRLVTSGPKPELVDLQKARFIIATEPGEDECFHSDAIKKLTGGDPITCRGMHWNKNITFHVYGQHNVLCNDLPNFRGVDGGLKRRMVNINYPVSFVNDPDPENPFEKPKNMKYKTDSWASRMAPSLMAILLDIHNNCVDNEEHEYQREPPIQVINRTKDWISNSNVLKAFLEEEFMGGCQPDLNGQKISAKDIWDCFKKTDYWTSQKQTQRKTKKDCFLKLIQTSDEWRKVYKSDQHGTFIYMSSAENVFENAPS